MEGPLKCCAFCSSKILENEIQCPKCDVLYHPECWVANGGRCAIFGCEKEITTTPEDSVPRTRANGYILGFKANRVVASAGVVTGLAIYALMGYLYPHITLILSMVILTLVVCGTTITAFGMLAWIWIQWLQGKNPRGNRRRIANGDVSSIPPPF